MKLVDVKLGFMDINGFVALPLKPVCTIEQNDEGTDIVIRCKFGPYKVPSPMFNCYKINNDNAKSAEGTRIIGAGTTFTVEIGL